MKVSFQDIIRNEDSRMFTQGLGVLQGLQQEFSQSFSTVTGEQSTFQLLSPCDRKLTDLS
jgi:hypothetical protein